MAMTVNASATPGALAPFRDGQGLDAFRFDTGGEARKDVSFKVRFIDVARRSGDNGRAQCLEVRRAAGIERTTNSYAVTHNSNIAPVRCCR